LPAPVDSPENELMRAARRAGAVGLVSDDAALPELSSLVRVRWPLDAGGDANASLPQLRSREPGDLLLCSSGTTGLPKIVRRSAVSLDAVARNMAEMIGFTSSDRVIAAVPLTHSYGIEHGLLSPLWAGSTVVLCAGLDLPSVARALREGATIFPAVPSMIELLSSVGDPTGASLRRVYSAGAALPRSVAEAFQRRFNVAVGQVYGLTEVGSVFYHDPSAADAPAQTVGRAAPGVSTRILAMDNPHQLLAPGEEGEVAVASPSMLTDYVDDELKLLDGHFPTGDLGRLDAKGYLTLTGRIRLLIDVGGAKVNPLEVESVLAMHPQVESAVVLPLKLSETVQKVRAVIVPRDRRDPPAAAALREFARQHLAAYKVPRAIEFRDSLPRTPTGKILRHLLETP
jgi:acyl-coenzyme A synthetase/AMP-(fatty) acid ligase